MNAVLKPEVRLEPLTEALLDDVLRIENSAYAHPWTRGNFADSLKSGYQLLALMGGATLIGYFVAMEGVDEVHLLNITVARVSGPRLWRAHAGRFVGVGAQPSRPMAVA
jgi:ribosomal-protein-alanine N-acetyltransferase